MHWDVNKGQSGKGDVKHRHVRAVLDAANGSNKSNFTDEFPLLNTSTSHINRRGQINRVEITKSRGNARRWRVCEETFAIEPTMPFINGPIFEDGIFVARP